MTKEIKLAVKTLEMMGHKVISVAKKTASGPDLHIEKDGIILRVEVKKARYIARSSAVHPIEPARKHDDIVVVVFPSGYVLVEPMEDYLACCADSGSRSFFGVY